MFENIISAVQKKQPHIHNITNFVSATDQANITLAVGGSPIMASSPKEAAQVCSVCDGLVLNTGILTDSALEAMLYAGEEANNRNIPIVLDPVGAGVSKFRTDAIIKIIKTLHLSAIHLNASELHALCTGKSNPGGVDAFGNFSLDLIISNSQRLSEYTGAVVAVTGADDVITQNERNAVVHNGSPMLKKITATGCMLSSVMGVYCAAVPDNIFDAVLSAVTLFGVSSQRAWKDGMGLGTYKIKFFDEITYPDFGGANIEYR